MQSKFPDFNNYTVNLKLSSDTYSTVHSTALIAKNNTDTAYKVERTIMYKDCFSFMREYMFTAMHGLYGYLYDKLATVQQHHGKVKNYFAVCICTANDTKLKVMSIDIYLIQADTVDDLLKNNEQFKAIPGINDEGSQQAIFNFGIQYEEDMNTIGATTKVYHTKVNKEFVEPVRALKLPHKFDMSTTETKVDVITLISNSDIMTYYIGINDEEWEG